MYMHRYTVHYRARVSYNGIHRPAVINIFLGTPTYVYAYTFIWCVRAQHMQISKVGNRFPEVVELIIGVMIARQS